jgi:hypothetical protein
MSSSRHISGILLELMFSLYSALLIVAREDSRDGSAIQVLLRAPLVWADSALLFLQHHPIFHHSPRYIFWGSWLVLTITFFVCCHLLSKSVLMHDCLSYAVGVLSAVGPFFGLRPILDSSTSGYLATAGWLHFLEVAVVVVCVVLFRHRRWPANAWTYTLLMLLHVGFWGFVSFGPLLWEYRWQAAAQMGLPFGIALVWSIRIRDGAQELS